MNDQTKDIKKIAPPTAAGYCPDCCRDHALNMDDAALGLCPKRFAPRDPSAAHDCERIARRIRALTAPQPSATGQEALTFDAWRSANVARCLKWHPAGINSWSTSDWMTAVIGELGELGSLIKMRNRERDGLPGNKFSPTDRQIADEIADVFAYLDLLAASLNVDLAKAAVAKFNEVSERVGFPDRINL